MTEAVTIVGGGLAGCEAALQVAQQGIAVQLLEMKPQQRSAAHHSDQLAEIVCSNSFGAQGAEGSASGLLKAEMGLLDCQLLKIAQKVSVPAGKALAVDRELFSQMVTETVHKHPLITVCAQEVTTLPDSPAVIFATGPPYLTRAGRYLPAIAASQPVVFF